MAGDDDRDRVFREVSSLGTRDFAQLDIECLSSAALQALGLSSGASSAEMAAWRAGLFWAVDPSNVSGVASDGNAGWAATLAEARTRPLLTFGELNARYAAQGSSVVLPAQCALMSDDPSTTLLSNIKGKNGTNRFTIIGDLTQVGSNYTVTAYADAVPSANTGYLLSATGLGGAGNLGKLVTNQAQTKFAFILAATTADQVLITQPHSYDPTTRAGATTGVTFAVSETICVWSLPSLSQYPFVGGSQVPAIWKCIVKRSALVESQFADSAATIVASSLEGLLVKGGNSGVLTGCCIQNGDLAWYDGGGVGLRNCGTRLSDINLLAGDYTLTNNLTISGSGSTFIVGAAGNAELFSGASIGIFNSVGSAVPGIQLGHGGQLNCYGSNAIFGAANTFAVEVLTQSKASVDKANCFATGGTAAINVHGISYAFADVPIWDPNNDCGVFDL